uniref:CCDC113/CCDC96 coiled-coil domain-containing protein n=1 Tax=Leptobrachium leishanense TaxID=445787 RepID=A0A8C5M0D5_9ANUR
MEAAGTGSKPATPSTGEIGAPGLESQDRGNETDMMQSDSSPGGEGAQVSCEHPGGQETAPREKEGQASGKDGGPGSSHGEEGGQGSSHGECGQMSHGEEEGSQGSSRGEEGGQASSPSRGEEGGQASSPSRGEEGGQASSPSCGEEGGQVSSPSRGEEGGQASSPSRGEEGGQVSSRREEGDQDSSPGEANEQSAGTGEGVSLQKQIPEYTIHPIPEEEAAAMGDCAEAVDISDPVSTLTAEDVDIVADTTTPDADREIMTPQEKEETENVECETESTFQEEPEDGNENVNEDEEEVKDDLIRQYQALVSEREKIQQQNAQLQNKLYEFFRRKKGEDTRPEISKHAPDQEQRYLKYLSTLEEMKKKYFSDSAFHQQQIEELRSQCQEVVSRVDQEWASFQAHKKVVALYGPHGGTKRASSTLVQELEQLQVKEERKEKEVIQVRLENIKLKNKIHYFEFILRSKEELSEGLHLIDFEQLKIENQTYNEKIEERNEELLKLRKKITNTVQMLSHVKEKLQFLQAENQNQRDKLLEVEALVAQKRDILTKTKQSRDRLRMDNLKLQQQCGLLGNKTLLQDFEEKVDVTDELQKTLETLKRRHAELTLSSKGMVKKIMEGKKPAQE